MRYVTVQIVGMIGLALGAQGAIRLLANHHNTGLLSWLPGGFAVALPVYAVLAVAGAALAAWANRKNARTGTRR
ncbi:hypothetical protein IU500_14775 [Nocardia terpenica]|uniref:Uncharacterized protein n=1 Tax=Nocardia terpenica TaxID=455432 RepID=A0A164LQH0_9NOCA|nr:hypothetical protein [Nocardia terpenica]KZM72660.1 hypothetical protein AWN90_28145 [Nocardia terpenica]MBF6061463.1 hypothetical protein [Nocardia terpenica]MBF6105308.1 hypothetical protein [Nocardia terpenica]MBF6113222.1 hypothetical protein [Nocardia terpenica]MBF6119352.1 hypothetical protein [Nocardia terpenica]